MKYIIYDIETSGLSPLKDRIVSIGIKTKEDERILMNDDEKKLIEEFWDYLKNHKKKYGSFVLVGYNSVAFDLYFIKIRSAYHKVPVMPIEKYKEHIDLYWVLTPYGSRKGKLDDFCNLFGFPAQYESMGDAVPKAWKDKNYELIIKHNEDDIRRTYQLFRVCLENNLIESEIDLRV